MNIKSLEDVVRKYIALAEEKTENARQESHQVVLDIDDLDQPDTPERYFICMDVSHGDHIDLERVVTLLIGVIEAYS